MNKYFIAAGVLAMSLTSCADFLDTQPQGSAYTTTYFQNDNQAIQVITGLYYNYIDEQLWGRNIVWEQIGANDFVLGRSYSDRFSGGFLTLGGDDGSISDIYSRCYTQIAHCQWIIRELEAKKASKGLSEIETRSLGEAYFFRGFFHFTVAYRHGLGDLGVPYKPWEEYPGGYNNEILPQQPSVVDNYLYIISDMKKAEEHLPWKGSITATYGAEDRGRAHKVSAIAYQAKAYAYMATWHQECEKRGLNPWGEVETLVNKLENDYGRGLNESFSQLFSSEFADFWNKECCFSCPGNGGSSAHGGCEFPGVTLENQGWGYYNGWGQFKPSYDIYAEMAKDNWEVVEGKTVKNERLKRSILEYGDFFMFFGEPRLYYSQSDVEAGLAVYKFFDAFKHKDPVANGYVNSNGDWPTTRINFHLIRFAELMLFRAEACMHLYGSDKYGDINKIHKRSVGKELGKTPTWADLYHERRCELAFEMTDHLHDIKRWVVTGKDKVGELYDLAYAELVGHPNVCYSQWSPMYGLLTDADGKYIINPDGTYAEGPLYIKAAKKADGSWDLDKEYEYRLNQDDVAPTKVKFNGVDEKYGYGLVDGKPVVYYGARNNPGAEQKVGPYADYNLPREWKNIKIAIPYPSAEITKSGGLYKQIVY